MCPSVNSKGNHFPYVEVKKQLLMTAYHQDIRTYFGCVLRRALAVWASLARFNPLSTSIHIQILQTDLNAFLNPLSPKSDQHQISPCSITTL